MSDRDVLVVASPAELGQARTRRSFLRALGVGGTIVLLPSVFAACGDDDDDATGIGGGVALDLSTDTGILNYAYALEQLEAAFYTQVVTAANFTTLITSAAERELFTDLRNHEVIHREFLKAAIPTGRIGDLAVDFTGALASRATIFQAAVAFEDLGVSAYNGAGRGFTDTDTGRALLTIAGKIVSVEARHASAVRDASVNATTAFADLASLTGLGADVASARDVVRNPTQVLTAADPYITTSVSLSKGLRR